MKQIFIIIILCTALKSNSQTNLIIDPSMEMYDSVVFSPPPIPGCDSLQYTPKYWDTPNSGSPDYIISYNNSCYFPWWPYTCCVPKNSRGWQ